MTKVYLNEMRWPEVRNLPKDDTIIIIPVGSNEQHGMHMPLGTDLFTALNWAERAAERTKSLVAPVLYAGLSEHHMSFQGTITLKPETFSQVLFETCDSLSKHGFKKILIVNSHGGNDLACKATAERASRELKISVTLFGVSDVISIVTKMSPKIAERHDFHAGVEETAWMLALRPETVDMTYAKKPTITLPGKLQTLIPKWQANQAFEKLIRLGMLDFSISDTGSIVFDGDPLEAKEEVEGARKRLAAIVDAIVFLIEEWKKV